MGVLYTALIGFSRFIGCCQECFLYTYTGVGLSALLVSDEQGNAKALTSGTSDRTDSTLLSYV